MQDARIPPNEQVLGTSDGLLLNELRCSPSATLSPLLYILNSTIELMTGPVHSPDASFVLFVAELAIDVQTYVDQVLEEKREAGAGAGASAAAAAAAADNNILSSFRDRIHNFLHGPLEEALDRWRREAEDDNDMPTACVIHSYLALLWFNLRPSDLEEGEEDNDASSVEHLVTSILGSLSFVRNWHGFGMGTLRSNVVAAQAAPDGTSSAASTATDRLLRFMQAHGIDTNHVTTC